MALLWGCAASSLSAEVERTTARLTHRIIEEAGHSSWGHPSVGAACQALRGARFAWALAGLLAGRFPF